MGAASSISSEVDVWAFKVCEKDYDRYKLFRKECIENDEEAYCEDENVFLMGLSQTFNTARVEKSLFIGLCKSPAVILYKWEEAMNAEERKEYTQTFDETVEAQEKLMETTEYCPHRYLGKVSQTHRMTGLASHSPT